ncbi:MAG: hypothetical protein EBY83_02135 [Verrucomicrobia bacterium]|nr:hypothetical protein [Verrucomicrobiota bacterium]
MYEDLDGFRGLDPSTWDALCGFVHSSTYLEGPRNLLPKRKKLFCFHSQTVGELESALVSWAKS